MATEVTVVDEAALTQTIDEVRSDSGDTNWCLVNHADGNPAVIQVCGSGNGGVEEMASNLADDQPMYALVRVTEIIDMSQTTKFVYVIWLGKDISFVKRGKFGVVSGSVERFFQPYQISVTFDGDSKEEVTQDHLMSKLQETSGTKSKVLEATEAKTRPVSN
jgi:non-ribosomal peptide synthetase component E (peptide arylation enzyme)